NRSAFLRPVGGLGLILRGVGRAHLWLARLAVSRSPGQSVSVPLGGGLRRWSAFGAAILLAAGLGIPQPSFSVGSPPPLARCWLAGRLRRARRDLHSPAAYSPHV